MKQKQKEVYEEYATFILLLFMMFVCAFVCAIFIFAIISEHKEMATGLLFIVCVVTGLGTGCLGINATFAYDSYEKKKREFQNLVMEKLEKIE